MRALMWMPVLCAGVTLLAIAPALADGDKAMHKAAAPFAEKAADPPGPSAQTCRETAARARSVRLDRALVGGFGVQYWGEDYTAEGLAAQPHGLLIIETTKIGALYSESGREVFFSPEEIKQISHDGARPVIGYLNIGEIENYRDYWIDFVAERGAPDQTTAPDWFGPHHGHGDHLASYWTPQWHEMMIARVDRLMASGVDGLFLDDVLQYYSHAADKTLVWLGGHRPDGPTEAPELARAMMTLVVDIAERVRAWKCDAFVVVNNAVFIGRDAAETADGQRARPVFESYLAAIDAIMVENLFALGADDTTRQALTEDFLDNGVKVMTLDVLSRHPSEDVETVRRNLSDDALEFGFVPYLVEDEGFNRLSPPVLQAGKS